MEIGQVYMGRQISHIDSVKNIYLYLYLYVYMFMYSNE